MSLIGILSDTHGYLDTVKAIAEQTKELPLQLWLHAGDYGDDARYLATLTKVPVLAVRGNNDRKRPLEPDWQIIPFEDTFIYMTHGHTLNYFNRREELRFAALHYEAKLIVLGHTHCYEEEWITDNCLMVNPGSPILPRDNSGGTYAIAEYRNGRFSVTPQTMK